MAEKRYLHQDAVLMSEYNNSKNLELDLETITLGSHLKVWWKCRKGHEWQASVYNRSKGKKCPYCSGRIAISGVNSLSDTHKDLLYEWDYEKNTIMPSELKATSNKKVWWICSKGHSWQSTVYNRVYGQGCPFCSNKKLLAGFNDLLTTNPLLAEEWNYEKNDDLPSEVFEKARKKVWWKCKKGHEWRAPLYSRSAGSGCPFCNQETQTSFPEQAILYYFSKAFRTESRTIIANKEIDVYLPDYKIGIEYDGKYYHGNSESEKRDALKDKVLLENGIILYRVKETKDKTGYDGKNIFYCQYSSISYEYLEYTILSVFQEICAVIGDDKKIDVNISRDVYEIQEQYRNTEKKNSILTKDPKIIKYWDNSKNGNISIEYVNYGTITKYWWKCPTCDKSWQRLPIKMIGKGCPYCEGTLLDEGFNDLATKHPELICEWDNELNVNPPYKYACHSNKKVHWICSNGHKYLASIDKRVLGRGCPICSNRKVVVGINDLKTLMPELASEWNYEKNNSLRPESISKGSKKKVWWKCNACGHEWKAYVYNRVRGDGCPNCNDIKNKRRLKTLNDKKRENGKQIVCFPELMAEWDYDANALLNVSPESLTSGSHAKVWWKCSKCGFQWQSAVYNRTKGHGCPKCRKK